MRKLSTSQEILSLGKQTDFWKMLVDHLENEIADLREEQQKDLKSLPADQYKLENELILAKIDYIKYLQTLPDSLILLLDNSENYTRVLDPYATSKDFK